MAYGLTKSATLTKSSKYFSVAGGATLALTNNITIEAWIKITDNTQDAMFLGKWGDATLANCSWFFYYDGAGNYQFSTSNVTTQGTSQVSWTPSNNTWYHVAVTFASNQVKFYVNGTQQGTTQTNTNSAFNSLSATNTNIGSYKSSSGGIMNGSVSLVRIWGTTVRTQSEISTNMCNVFGTATTNMLAEWSLDNVLTDASGNGLTLTNNGSIAFATDTPSTCAVLANSGFFMAATQ